MVAHPEETTGRLVSLGMRPDVGAELAAGYTEDMGRCILGLYRDAAQPALARLGRWAREYPDAVEKGHPLADLP